MKILLNLITGNEIIIPDKNKSKLAKSLGIDPSTFFKLFYGKINHVCDVFVLKDSKNLFTLVNYDSGKEYVCVSNSTIFRHLNINYNENESKYIHELKKGQKLASINGSVFYLKGKEPMGISVNLKTESKTNSIMYKKELRITRVFSRLLLSTNVRIHKKTSNWVGLKTCRNLLGCDKYTFFNHIESKFEEGMTWDNYGHKGWHIDHIIPVSSGNLNKYNELSVIFNYKNTRPLWATTNVAIANKSISIGNLNRPRPRSNSNLPITTIP